MTRLMLAAFFAAAGSLGLAAEAPKPKPKAPAPKAKPKAKAKAPAKPKAKATPAKPKPKPKPAPKKAKPKPKPKAKPKPMPAPKPETLGPGTYALLKTEKGDILLQLFPEKSPNTVANFVELAKGERPWKDKEGRWVAKPYYDGLTFHRIEKDELIQGGCPRGDGTGGPGYEFDNESSDELKFDQAGVVAMANSGRNRNGSRFFITLKPTPQYDGRYTIFGKVVHGLDTVRAISRMDATGRTIHTAKKPVKMQKVVINEVKPKPKGEAKKEDTKEKPPAK